MQEYNHKYAFPVQVEWSQEELLKLYEDNKDKANLATLRLKVSEHDYLQQLQNKYQWLGDWLDFFITYPGIGYPIHIDNTVQDRKVVMNLPVLNAEKSLTNWYELPESAEWIQSDPYKAAESNSGVYSSTGKFLKASSIKEQLIPVFSMVTTEPVIIETKLPHDVKNKTTSKRIIASWHLKFDSFTEAKRYLLNV